MVLFEGKNFDMGSDNTRNESVLKKKTLKRCICMISLKKVCIL